MTDVRVGAVEEGEGDEEWEGWEEVWVVEVVVVEVEVEGWEVDVVVDGAGMKFKVGMDGVGLVIFVAEFTQVDVFPPPPKPPALPPLLPKLF